MTLRSLVSDSLQQVNASVSVEILQSTGYTTNTDFSRTPTYTTITTDANGNPLTGDVQPLSAQDLKKLAGLNMQNVTQKIYLDGNYEGVFRVLGKGGDLIKFGGQTYLVTAVLERWPTWCSLGLTMQLDGA